jgi:hypothetical protein
MPTIRIKNLLEALEETDYQLIRFFFYLDQVMTSITLVKGSLLELGFIPSFLTIEPDLKTGFNHPTSLQLTYCILASLPGDDRSQISGEEGFFFLTSIIFSLEGSEEDTWQDFRSELLIEGQKAGLKLLNHTNQSQEIIMDLLAFSPLDLADSLEKFKIIAQAIATSYAKKIHWEPLEANLIIRRKKCFEEITYNDLYHEASYDIIYLKSIKENCYQQLKDLW